jgi:tripartite-type tricarboxylate transporter receptor subunit TctC
MKRSTCKAVALSIAVVLLFSVMLLGCGSKEQAYPGTNPILGIVPWSAGGSTDMVARGASTGLAGKISGTVNVVDEPGGQGIPGTMEVMQSKADGYTLLADADGSNAIPAAWGTDIPFKLEERTYICKIASFPWVFAVSKDSGFTSLDDVAEAIQNDPASVEFGWLGGTAGADCETAQFIAALKAKGIDTSKVNMVTYSGGSDLATAIAGGHVDIGSCSTTSVASVFEAGKVDIISITSPERFSKYPDVPTTREQGWDSVNYMGHVGYSGPAGMPDDIVKKISDAMGEFLSSDDAKTQLDAIGAVPDYLSHDDYTNYVMNLADTLVSIKIS